MLFSRCLHFLVGIDYIFIIVDLIWSASDKLVTAAAYVCRVDHSQFQISGPRRTSCNPREEQAVTSLSRSVGQGGQNEPQDVKVVQRLLNRHTLKNVRRLHVDGLSGPQTIRAIREFQAQKVGMRHPDGRVDPGGRTLRALRDTGSRPPAADRPKRETPESRREDRQRRKDFVDPRVRETNTTTKIIDAIEPHFRGTKAKVISGYLNDSDLFWKVNYHWEYLLWMVEHSLSLDISDRHRARLQAIHSNLLSNTPNPDKGYRTSRNLGRPADQSSYDMFDKRYRLVRQAKRDFKKIVRAADLPRKSSRSANTFALAAAPVAHPGTSKHSTGYALDIKGPNRQIASIAKGRGASLTFDEDSHVHIEFRNGAA